jgi:hypothetical protein
MPNILTAFIFFSCRDALIFAMGHREAGKRRVWDIALPGIPQHRTIPWLLQAAAVARRQAPNDSKSGARRLRRLSGSVHSRKTGDARVIAVRLDMGKAGCLQ